MKKLIVLLLAMAMLFSLAACTSGGDETPPAESGDPAPAESEAPVEGGDDAIVSPDNDLVVAFQADATSLDPHIGSNGISNTINNTIYESLVKFDENVEIAPMLAKSWSVAEDNKTYTFVLEEGIMFHDNTPFNAEAVVANYQRGQDDDTLRIATQTATWESVTAVSEYEVEIVLMNPDNTFLNKLTQIRIISPTAITELGKEGIAQTSVGTGPYMLSERIEGSKTVLTVNENYWAEGPSVDSLTFLVVPEDGARIAMLQTGEADVIHPLPAIQVQEVEDDASIVINNIPGITYRYATLNQNYTLEDGRQPFADVRVRQAMNYAFDSVAYAQVVFQGFAKEPTSVFSDSILYYAEQTPYSIDLEMAASLMAEAGFEDGFPVNIWVDNTTIEQQGAEFFKQQMAQINIDVNVMPMESATIAEMTDLPAEETEVQIWYVNWGSGSYETDGSMRSILHSDRFPPVGYNTAFYSNPEFDALMDEALMLTDTAEIADLYAQAQAIAWEDAPWVFLGNDNTINAQKSYVEGLVYMPGGDIKFTTASLVMG